MKLKDSLGYGVFEVYYNSKGKPISRTEHPFFTGDSKKDILGELALMVKDIKANDSIDFF
jgi:hypothetical protein